jgi:hypothetical protein
MKTLGLALFLAALPPQEGASETLVSSDFETADWWKAWGMKEPAATLSLVEGEAAFGGRGKSLKVTIPKGQNTGANFHYRFRERVGSEPEEMYFRYDVKFDPGWKAAADGGKMPGFSGTYGRAGWGGRPVDGRNGWSARGHFGKPRPDAEDIGWYCYHADMKGKYGNVWKFQPPLQYGRWYGVELYCKLNAPGKNDGILRAWIDGQAAFEKTDLRFRDVDALKIESVWVNVYHGGTARAPADLVLYFDNMVISRKPIGVKAR